MVPRKLTYGRGVSGSRYEDILYLVAAYDIDIAGLHPPDRLYDDEAKTLSRHRGHGRRLLAQAHGWPWAAFGPEGKLPRGHWWEREIAVTAWRAWVLGGTESRPK